MNIITNPARKIKVVITMLLILIAAITFAIQSQPTAPVTRYAPGNPAYEVMRRESEPCRSILVNLPNGRTLVWEVA